MQQVLDPPIVDTPDDEIATFCEIAAACCQNDPFKRPRMREVRKAPDPRGGRARTLGFEGSRVRTPDRPAWSPEGRWDCSGRTGGGAL